MLTTALIVTVPKLAQLAAATLLGNAIFGRIKNRKKKVCR